MHDIKFCVLGDIILRSLREIKIGTLNLDYQKVNSITNKIS